MMPERQVPPALPDGHHPQCGPTVTGGTRFRRGASDAKGHIAFRLLGMQAHLAASGRTAPAGTVKLLVEGEEESGSPHITGLLAVHAAELACDLIVVSDTGMFADGVPSICTGMRGLAGAEVTFRAQGVDLHSGQFGGAVPNPVTALARLVAALHDDDGRIQVPGFYDDVREPSVVEREAFAKLPFDEAGWLAGPAGGARGTTGERGWSTLERLWVRPTAEVNGFAGGYQGPGGKTIVPTEAFAKLSFRLVPDQVPDKTVAGIRQFVTEHTPPGIEATVEGEGGVPACLSDVDHPGVVAVRDAMTATFGQEVLFSREGGAGPEAIIQAELAGAPLAFLGVGLPDDRIHAPNENHTSQCASSLSSSSSLSPIWPNSHVSNVISSSDCASASAPASPSTSASDATVSISAATDGRSPRSRTRAAARAARAPSG